MAQEKEEKVAVVPKMSYGLKVAMHLDLNVAFLTPVKIGSI